MDLIENYLRYRTYAITISPRCNKYWDDNKQCLYTYHELTPKLRLWTTRYTIYPELSRDMRLHYHGVITGLKKQVNKLKGWIHKYIGFTRVEPLQTPLDHIRYLHYCKKDWSDNQYIFKCVLTPWTAKKIIKRRKTKHILNYYKL